MSKAATVRVDSILGPEHHVRNTGIARPLATDYLAYRWRSNGAPAFPRGNKARLAPLNRTDSQSLRPRTISTPGSGHVSSEVVLITESDIASLSEASCEFEPCATPPPEGLPRRVRGSSSRDRSPNFTVMESCEIQDFEHRKTCHGAMVHGDVRAQLIEGLQQIERVAEIFCAEKGKDITTHEATSPTSSTSPTSPMMATLLSAKGLRSRRWHSDEKLVCLFLGVLTVLSFKECGVVVGGKHGLL